MNNKVQWVLTCWNIGDPSSKAKYYKFSDSLKYCEGKFEKCALKTLSEIEIWISNSISSRN